MFKVLKDTIDKVVPSNVVHVITNSLLILFIFQ
jgi:hypothetical protein